MNRHLRIALGLVLLGYTVPLVTLVAELRAGWLPPHGDDGTILLASIALMIASCAIAARLTWTRAGPPARHARWVRALALTDAVAPAALVAGALFLGLTAGSGR